MQFWSPQDSVGVWSAPVTRVGERLLQTIRHTVGPPKNNCERAPALIKHLEASLRLCMAIKVLHFLAIILWGTVSSKTTL